MVLRPSRLSTLLVLGAALSCQNRGPLLLRDTEGRTFEASCPKGGACTVSQKSGPKRPGMPTLTLHTASRLVGVCDALEGQAPQGPFDCRPLGCDSDRDCPPLHEMKEGQCLNHRCSDPAQAIDVRDSVMLCLAGTGLGRETPAQIERYALALNCGTPCTVPAPCQQP